MFLPACEILQNSVTYSGFHFGFWEFVIHSIRLQSCNCSVFWLSEWVTFSNRTHVVIVSGKPGTMPEWYWRSPSCYGISVFILNIYFWPTRAILLLKINMRMISLYIIFFLCSQLFSLIQYVRDHLNLLLSGKYPTAWRFCAWDGYITITKKILPWFTAFQYDQVVCPWTRRPPDRFARE